MSDPRSEAVVTLSDGRKLRLVRGLRALAVAERQTGKPYAEMVAALQSGKAPLDYTAALMFGMLSKHHPEIEFDDVFDMLESDGEVLARAFPDEGGAASGEAKAAGAGTGTPSSPRARKKG